MNLANKLTLSRFFLTVIFMVFLFSKGLQFKILAFVMFTIACWTDFLDGYIAKKRNQISDFGKFMDPVADKVLIISAFLAFVEMRLIPAWIVVIIIFREFSITGLRFIALSKGNVISAERLGKHKTVSQMASIYMVLILIIFRESQAGIFGFWDRNTELIYLRIIYYAMLVTAFLTMASGISFILKNRKLFTNAKNI